MDRTEILIHRSRRSNRDKMLEINYFFNENQTGKLFMQDDKQNIIPQNHKIGRVDRIKNNGHDSKVFWFTGLSGSGKSTLAGTLETDLYKQGFSTYLLDGDNIRTGLNQDLDFSDLGRQENIRRISEVSKLFIDAGIIVLTAFISPFKKDREKAKAIIGEKNFIEIYVKCPLEICEKRDVKGLYKKARSGKIKNFTGINSSFEPPQTPDLIINTDQNTLSQCLDTMKKRIEKEIKY